MMNMVFHSIHLLLLFSLTKAFLSPTALLHHPIGRLHQQLNGESPNGVQECALDGDGASACLTDAGYKVDTSSFACVTEVFVAEVESLRDEFESFETEGDETSNIIKYNKRFGGSHILSESDGKPSRANMEYNELIGERDIVLVDTVRKEGMSSVSRAFHRAGPRKLL